MTFKEGQRVQLRISALPKQTDEEYREGTPRHRHPGTVEAFSSDYTGDGSLTIVRFDQRENDFGFTSVLVATEDLEEL